MSARWALALGAVLLATAPVAAGAQERPRAPEVELRADALVGDRTAWHGGAGVTWPLGRYARAGVVGAAGVTDVGGDDRRTSGRAELVVRYVVDPSGGTGARWYGGAGAGVLLVRGATGVARAHVVVGADRPLAGRLRLGLEAGVGGGTRIGVVLRRGEP